MAKAESPSNFDRISVACPACGEVYHLRRDTQRWQCRNGACRRSFDIAAAISVSNSPPSPIADSTQPPAAPLIAKPLDDEIFEIPLSAMVVRPPQESGSWVAASRDSIPELPPGDGASSAMVVQPLGEYEPPPRKSAAARWRDSTSHAAGVEMPAAEAISPNRRGTSGAVAAVNSPAKSRVAAGPRDCVSSGSRKISEHDQRHRFVRRVLVGAVVVCVGVAVATWWLRPVPDPNKDWQTAQELFKDKRWTPAKRALEKFAEQFPDDGHAADVPFFVDLAAAGEDIYSEKGRIDQGWTELQRIFQHYRDQPVYNAYRSDLYFAAKQLAERFVKRAAAENRLSDLQLARDAFQLQRTIAQSMNDSFVAEQLTSLAMQLDATEQQVRLELARREAHANLLLAQSPDAQVDVDAIYAADESWMRRFPGLLDDAELKRLRQGAYQAESRRVRYQAESAATSEPRATIPAAFVRPSTGSGQDLLVVWGDEVAGGTPNSRPRGSRDVVLSLARGVLYAFDQEGVCLWGQRLGIDVTELPIFLAATATNPDLFIAVSTLDNALLAIEPLTGRIRWRYQTGDGQWLHSLPTIVTVDRDGSRPSMQRLLLPAGREIHVLEPVLGKRIGRFLIGQPMTSPGVFDERTGLVYFPADNKRLYALDPRVIDDTAASRAACPSMLFTEHASGALRSAPAVVGPYLILAEATELAQMKLRTFLVHKADEDETGVNQAAPAIGDAATATRPARPDGFVDPKTKPAKEVALRGWSWFHPSATPDRIAVVTDEGELGVFGLNLDNPQEALYPLIQDAQRQSTRLPIADPYRTLAVYSEEHLLWVMAGGRLRQFFLDVIGQSIKPLEAASNAAGQVTGIPVHPAELDRTADTFFLTTMSVSGDDFAFSAIDVDRGELWWQRHLGLNLASDPLVVQRGILLIDRSGRLLGLSASEPAARASTAPRIVQRPRQNDLPPGAQAEELLRLAGPDGGFYLVAITEGGRRLAIRFFNDQAISNNDWRTVALPAPLRGQPAIAGDHVLVPCADRLLYTLRFASNTESDEVLPFSLASSGLRDAAGVRVFAPDQRSLLLVEGKTLRRLSLHTEANVTRWQEVGSALVCRQRILGGPQLVDQRLLVVDAGGFVYRLSFRGETWTADQPWRLASGSMRSPWTCGGRALVIENDRVLHRLPTESDEANRPAWSSPSLPGRICGEPTLLDEETLLVTDTSGHVTALKLGNGSLVWQLRLAADVGPAAAAVRWNTDRLLVPLTDGTLLDVAIPAVESTRIAEVAK